MPATTSPARTILVKTRDGDKLVEGVPASAKITFGPVQPGKDAYGRENCLRIYTTANNQLAVFVGVTEFRDMSLQVKAKKVKEKQNRKAEFGPNGEAVETETETSWSWETEGF